MEEDDGPDAFGGIGGDDVDEAREKAKEARALKKKRAEEAAGENVTTAANNTDILAQAEEQAENPTSPPVLRSTSKEVGAGGGMTLPGLGGDEGPAGKTDGKEGAEEKAPTPGPEEITPGASVSDPDERDEKEKHAKEKRRKWRKRRRELKKKRKMATTAPPPPPQSTAPPEEEPPPTAEEEPPSEPPTEAVSVCTFYSNLRYLRAIRLCSRTGWILLKCLPKSLGGRFSLHVTLVELYTL